MRQLLILFAAFVVTLLFSVSLATASGSVQLISGRFATVYSWQNCSSSGHQGFRQVVSLSGRAITTGSVDGVVVGKAVFANHGRGLWLFHDLRRGSQCHLNLRPGGYKVERTFVKGTAFNQSDSVSKKVPVQVRKIIWRKR